VFLLSRTMRAGLDRLSLSGTGDIQNIRSS
jgi:hypothetical protein